MPKFKIQKKNQNKNCFEEKKIQFLKVILGLINVSCEKQSFYIIL